MEEFLKILAGVFGGGLFTALAFVFAQSNKITSIATRQKSQGEKLDNIYNELHNGFTCTRHAEIMEKLGKLEGSETKK